MNKRFEGKTALVTGAGSGIGRATALAFALEGANVVVSDISAEGGEETVHAIHNAGADAIFVRCDVSRTAEVQTLIRRTIETYGALHAAVNNAGIGGVMAPSADYPEEEWTTLIGINLTGVWLCMKYEIREMLKTGGGAIVNMSSILGTVGFPNASAYVASKHGVIGLTRAAALEYANQGIRINAICPGFIVTPMLQRAGILDNKEMNTYVTDLHPIKRMGKPGEIADAILWLCSEESSFVVGHPLLVDGGYVVQ